MLRRLSRHLGYWLIASSLLIGCSDEQPARGQLMLALSTDMSIPKDVSQVRIEITTDSGRRFDFKYDIAPDGKFYLPGTIAIVAGQKPAERVQIQVIGIRRTSSSLTARTLSKVVTTIPKARVARVPLPIQWLCDGSVLSTGDADSEPEYLSACGRDADGQELACLAGECVPVDVKEEDLPDFVAPKGALEPDPDAPLEDGTCFDTVTCLEAGQDVVPTADCTFGVVAGEQELNVGLRLAPGGDGICDEGRPEASCYIPLNRSESGGWREAEPTEGSDVRTIVLPKAVCTKLAAGDFQAVRVTASCPTKTEGRATCGPWTNQGAPSEPVDAGPIVVIGAGGEGGAGETGGAGGEAGESGQGGVVNIGGTGVDIGGTGVDVGGFPGAGSVNGGSKGDGGSGGSGVAGTAAVGGTGVGGFGGFGDTEGGGATSTGGFGGVAGTGTGTGGVPEGGTDAGGGGDSDSGGGRGGAGQGGTGPTVTDCVNGPLLFADPNFEAGLRAIIEKPVGALMPADVAGLTNLDLNSRGITKLEGIECLSDLQVLNLAFNSVGQLTALATLTDLIALELTSNQVSDLSPLTGLLNLDLLKLGFNNVADLSPLVANVGLGIGDVVDASVNPLNCELQGSNIGQLDGRGVIFTSDCYRPTDCANGPLTFVSLGLEAAVRDALSLPFGAIMPVDVSQLTSLDASSRAIDTLAGLECLPGLQVLDLSDNSISDIGVLNAFSELRELSLTDNQASDLTPLEPLANLQILRLERNGIVNIGTLMGFVQLSVLDLTGNQITTIAPLTSSQGLGDGDLIGVRDNPLDCVIDHSFITHLRSRGANVLTDCVYPPTDCETGPLTFVDPNLEQAVRFAIEKFTGDLMPIDVSELSYLSTGSEGGANVHSLEGIQCLQSLNTLVLADNFITDISRLSTLDNLQYLSLNGNQVTDLTPLSGLTNLQTLSLNFNFISDLTPLSSMSSLDELYLVGNQLTELAPLVANFGLSEGDFVDVSLNLLSCPAQAENIQALQNRFVSVISDCNPPL